MSQRRLPKSHIMNFWSKCVSSAMFSENRVSGKVGGKGVEGLALGYLRTWGEVDKGWEESGNGNRRGHLGWWW